MNDPLHNIFFTGLKGSPDIAAAEKVAKFIGTKHYSYTFTVQQGLDALRDVIYHLGAKNLIKEPLNTIFMWGYICSFYISLT